MAKPKGGRGKKAPYETKQMRVPVPLEPQVMELCERYREFVAAGGDPIAPPSMLESRTRSQPETASILEPATRSQRIADFAPMAFEAIGTTGEDWFAKLSEFLEELAEAIDAIKVQQHSEPEPDPKPEPEPEPEPAPTKPRSDREQIWDELNERQQTYLKYIFEIDQDRERSERGAWNRGGRPRPADQWRWIEYFELFGNSSLLRQKLKAADVVDPGTGSTFKALTTRKLVEIRYAYRVQDWFDCKLTRLGRAVVRAGLGITTPKKLPPRTLHDYQWDALAATWDAGEEGLPIIGFHRGAYGGYSWQHCWLRLRDWNDKIPGAKRGLVKEFQKDGEYRIRITEEGRQFYRENWQKYRELYPEVEAAAPE